MGFQRKLCLHTQFGAILMKLKGESGVKGQRWNHQHLCAIFMRYQLVKHN